MDFNKKSLPETGTSAAWKGIPKMSRISIEGNPPRSKSKYDDYSQIPLKSLKKIWDSVIAQIFGQISFYCVFERISKNFTYLI